ncbi:Ribonuclease P protein subunit p29 [Halotydeus destructor]|nr:Ribonuclease P protein subunit p29 [Halotydeus destructor]
MHSDTDQLDLIRADYHGAQFVIEASRNPSLVGIKGIVVQETKNTFKLIAETNRIITVPKEGTLFTFLCNGKLYKICGNYMALSPQQRSRTKIKVRKAKDEV